MPHTANLSQYKQFFVHLLHLRHIKTIPIWEKAQGTFNVPYAFLFSLAVLVQTFSVLPLLFSFGFSFYAPARSVPAVISMPVSSICFFASRCIRFGFLFISFTTVYIGRPGYLPALAHQRCTLRFYLCFDNQAIRHD